MSRWLASGLRRDCCIALAGLDDPTGQELKAAVETHYDERVPPRRFHGALDALVESGHVDERTDGIHDRYSLTDAGAAALSAHAQWVTEQVDADEG